MTASSIVCVMWECRRGICGAQCGDKRLKGRVCGQMVVCMIGDEL